MNCCICNKEIKNYGNNAEPFKKGTCCDKCNNQFVIPSRMLDIILITDDMKKLIKELRNRTGAGMIECKTALFVNDWNIDRSYEWIKDKGLC